MIKAIYNYLYLLMWHKIWVYRLGRHLGLGRWQLLHHDLSKFLPSELIGYSVWKMQQLKKGGGGLVNDRTFAECFFLHTHKRNRHHWQWYIYAADSGEIYPLEIPEPYRTELLVDWAAAGIVRFGVPDLEKYYQLNKARIHLHPITRTWLESSFADVELAYVNCKRP